MADDMQRMIVGFATHIKESDHKDLLIYSVMLQALFCCPLVICSLVVSGTANSGFAYGLLTAFLNMGFIGGSYYTLKERREAIVLGFLIGVVAMLSIVNFSNSIFWGQLSGCEPVPKPIGQYTCDHPAAYGAVCTFSVFMFLTQIFFGTGLVLWRNELVLETLNSDGDTAGFYDDLPQASCHRDDKQESVDL